MATPPNDAQKSQRDHEIEYYKNILKKMPKFSSFSIRAHLKLGQLYADMGDKEAAIHEYSTAAVQYVHNGELVKAMAAHKMIIELAPAKEHALASLAQVYFQQGDIVEPCIEPLETREHLDKPSKESSNRQELEKILAKISLFCYLASEEQRKITEFLCPISAKQHTTILQEGDEGDCMYLIQSGEVGVYTMLMEKEDREPADAEYDQLHLATLKEGDFFGEQALITNDLRNATVIALTDVQLLRFSKPDLEAIVRSYPRVEALLRQYHQQRNAATINSLKSALQKVRTQDSAEAGSQ